jgi:microsomal dipeptidase-like Zn-dependent dipeptidase
MIEHSICMLIDCPSKKYTPAELKTFIDAAGVDHTFFGSDLGQAKNPSPVTGFRTIIGILLDLGYSHEDIGKMVGSNGASLVGLGANASPKH